MNKKELSNPFNPMFGSENSALLGRDEIIKEFLDGLENKAINPNRATIITGIRGSGKTTLLTHIGNRVHEKGYVSINVTASENMLLDIIDQVIVSAENFVDGKGRGIKGIKIGGFGITLEDSKNHKFSFRTKLANLIEQLNKEDVGVLFEIDEVQKNTREIREFTTSFQHYLREGKNVALLMAGLPHSISAVLNDDILTFLRRSKRIRIGNINPEVLKVSLGKLFKSINKSIGKSAIETFVAESGGYPYLIQLIGYYAFLNSSKKIITLRNVEEAVESSKKDLFANVHELVFEELSEKDREFLFAMINSKGELNSFAEIANKLKATKSYASQYRERLISNDVIYPVSRGKLDFTLPYMKEYLLDEKTEQGLV
jgi:nucleoside-triphosphatase THEP1